MFLLTCVLVFNWHVRKQRICSFSSFYLTDRNPLRKKHLIVELQQFWQQASSSSSSSSSLQSALSQLCAVASSSSLSSPSIQRQLVHRRRTITGALLCVPVISTVPSPSQHRWQLWIMDMEPNTGTATRVPGLQIFSHSLCVGATAWLWNEWDVERKLCLQQPRRCCSSYTATFPLSVFMYLQHSFPFMGQP